MKKKTPLKPFTEQAKAFFQEQNDQEEFTTPPIQGDYVDYLLGDTMDNSISGLEMESPKQLSKRTIGMIKKIVYELTTILMLFGSITFWLYLILAW